MRWVALLLSAAAAAAPPEKPAAVEAGPRPVSTAIAIGRVGSEAAIDEAIASVEQAAAADARLDLKPVSREPALSDADRKTLEAADAEVRAARDLLLEMQFAEGIPRLVRVLEQYESLHHAVCLTPGKVGEMVEVLIEISVGRFFEGDDAGAQDALGKAFTWNPDLQFDEDRFPPSMETLVNDARMLFDNLGRGFIDAASQPVGARVCLNGRLVGYTPQEIGAVPTGDNLVTFLAPGHEPLTVRVTIAGAGQRAKAEGTLVPLAGDPRSLVAGALAEARAAAPGQALPPEATRLAAATAALGAEALIVGEARAAVGGATVKLWFYDGRRNRVAAPAESLIWSEGQAAALVQMLLGEDPFGLQVVAAAPPEPEGPGLIERVRTWPSYWDVVALGATVVVVGGAVATLVILEQQQAGLSPGERFVVVGF